MKRDPELCRKLLVLIEEQAGYDKPVISENIEIDDPINVAYNLEKLAEEGLIKVKIAHSSTGEGIPPFIIIDSVTVDGHRILETIRDNGNWEKVKKFILSRSRELTWELVKAVHIKVLLDM